MPLTKADIQRLRDLREKKHREAAGRYVVENPKVIAELLAAGQVFTELYVTPPGAATLAEAAAARERFRAPAVTVTEEEMARISHLPTPSPVLAVGMIARRELAEEDFGRGLTLALDGIQDPGNVGTLLRVADWFGFARVVLSPDCADLFSQKVINASMGSFARMRVFTGALAPVLARAGVPVLGADLAGESVYGMEPMADAVVVIGSEGRGPSAAVRPVVTRWVTIPRVGGAESLNAAVAAGIVCATLRRPG